MWEQQEQTTATNQFRMAGHYHSHVTVTMVTVPPTFNYPDSETIILVSLLLNYIQISKLKSYTNTMPIYTYMYMKKLKMFPCVQIYIFKAHTFTTHVIATATAHQSSPVLCFLASGCFTWQQRRSRSEEQACLHIHTQNKKCAVLHTNYSSAWVSQI